MTDEVADLITFSTNKNGRIGNRSKEDKKKIADYFKIQDTPTLKPDYEREKDFKIKTYYSRRKLKDGTVKVYESYGLKEGNKRVKNSKRSIGKMVCYCNLGSTSEEKYKGSEFRVYVYHFLKEGINETLLANVATEVTKELTIPIPDVGWGAGEESACGTISKTENGVYVQFIYSEGKRHYGFTADLFHEGDRDFRIANQKEIDTESKIMSDENDITGSITV